VDRPSLCLSVLFVTFYVQRLVLVHPKLLCVIYYYKCSDLILKEMFCNCDQISCQEREVIAGVGIIQNLGCAIGILVLVYMNLYSPGTSIRHLDFFTI
jgi:hypothetical protein